MAGAGSGQAGLPGGVDQPQVVRGWDGDPHAPRQALPGLGAGHGLTADLGDPEEAPGNSTPAHGVIRRQLQSSRLRPAPGGRAGHGRRRKPGLRYQESAAAAGWQARHWSLKKACLAPGRPSGHAGYRRPSARSPARWPRPRPRRSVCVEDGELLERAWSEVAHIVNVVVLEQFHQAAALCWLGRNLQQQVALSQRLVVDR